MIASEKAPIIPKTIVKSLTNSATTNIRNIKVKTTKLCVYLLTLSSTDFSLPI